MLQDLWRDFVSIATVRLPIWLVEFGEETFSREFQMDQEIGGKYDMIIGSDIMTEMGINLLCRKHCIEQDSVHVPLKLQGELSDGKYCEQLYNMHTNSPILHKWRSVKAVSLMLTTLRLILMLWLMVLIFKDQVKEQLKQR